MFSSHSPVILYNSKDHKTYIYVIVFWKVVTIMCRQRCRLQSNRYNLGIRVKEYVFLCPLLTHFVPQTIPRVSLDSRLCTDPLNNKRQIYLCAPLSRSNRTIALLPPALAACRALLKTPPTALTFAPLSRSNRTIGSLPRYDATCRALP